jgi:hypothetical protein
MNNSLSASQSEKSLEDSKRIAIINSIIKNDKGALFSKKFDYLRLN